RADPPLSPEGERQAELLGEWLKHEHVHAVYASHLLRGQQTAAPIAAAHKLAIVTEPDIAAFDRDASSYIPFEEDERNRAEFRAIVTGDYTAIGGPDPKEFIKK